MTVLYLGSNEKKNLRGRSEQDWKRKQKKMNSLKIKLQKCQNVKGKLNNMEQVEMKY